MPRFRLTDLFATGMAIFAMFFGAGNIIFPLVLGRHTGEQTPYAFLGLSITAVLIPFAGLLSMFLYRGDVRAFFGRFGNIPGLAGAFFIIALLGPFGSTPRCIALAFSCLDLSFPGLTPLYFNLIACVCLYLMACKSRYLLTILGYLLTPVLLGLLALIILKGFFGVVEPGSFDGQLEAPAAFRYGLKEGYNTMDLLASFFFAPVIIRLTLNKTRTLVTETGRLYFFLLSGAIGVTLLGAVYFGFSLLAAKYALMLVDVPAQDLLGVISMQILGPYAGPIVCLTVVLACLTTAVALITAFSGFVHKEIVGERIDYRLVLACSLLLTFAISCLEFQGISEFLTPVLEAIYPLLIALTGFNLAESLYRTLGASSVQERIESVG